MKFRISFLGALVLSFGALVSVQGAENSDAGAWQTAFFKRGFCGKMNIAWSGDPQSTLRVPVYIPLGGSKVRFYLESSNQGTIELSNLALVKGADRLGNVQGPSYPILFSGAPHVTIPERIKSLVSDEVSIPVTEGLWYLEQKYGTPECLYAYDTDGYFSVTATSPTPKFNRGSWAGNVSRVDVFGPDAGGIIACFGDSITQGAGATAGSGNRYPQLLEMALKKPVINMGVNGDLASFAKGMPGMVQNLSGVKRVVFLMGINDIISGKMTNLEDYKKTVTAVIQGVKSGGRTIHVGTITPAGGYAKFDADPAKETLRQEINTWIRGQTLADGVIDYDAALRDPADSRRLKDEYQSDRLHPSDAGYQKMAETAAAVLSK